MLLSLSFDFHGVLLVYMDNTQQGRRNPFARAPCSCFPTYYATEGPSKETFLVFGYSQISH
jgi:hypothetical protein